MDVDEPLVRADLEVLARVLILERALDDAVDVFLCGERHGARDGRAAALRCLHDGLRAALDQLVIVRLQPYADLLLSHSRLLCPVHVAGCVRRASATKHARPDQCAATYSMILVTVSYTHLRAHETRHDLVCRLLLE